jgi:2-dehydro-3-deoxyphosphogluconate aldolase / (4S)-4-hydroxy-2-oxoglutarate aldolase
MMLELHGLTQTGQDLQLRAREMHRHETLAKIIEQGVVPVIADVSPEEAARVIKAVYRRGIRVAEITMSAPGAFAVIEKLVDEFGDEVTFGAGGVLHADIANACLKAGAEYIASPVMNYPTIDAVKLQSKAMIAGALTPTEVVTAWEAHADAVRIFPCTAVGGPAYLASLKHTFPEVEMMPAGSLNLETTSKFLKAGASAVAVGRAFIDAKTVAQGRYDVFEERARRYLAEVAKTRVRPA